MSEQTHPEQSESRTVVDVDITYHFQVDVTDWLDTPSYRGPDRHELAAAAEGIMEYHHGESGRGRDCVGYSIKARV